MLHFEIDPETLVNGSLPLENNCQGFIKGLYKKIPHEGTFLAILTSGGGGGGGKLT